MPAPRKGFRHTLKALYDWLDSGGAAGATKPAITALTPVTTPDATDLPTALTLANANKAKINAIIAALKS